MCKCHSSEKKVRRMISRMNSKICLLVAGITLLDAVIFTESQECDKYELISDSRRSTQNVFVMMEDSPISDMNLDPTKWYRFRSYVGNSIPERAENDSVALEHCGTTYPMYISGLNKHPTEDNEGRKAIAKVLDWQANISIYKCPPDEENAESFFIYLLEPAPADQTAYCAGEGFPCPEGEMHNGFECVGYFPTMDPPIFSGPYTTGHNAEQQIYFTCVVQYNKNPPNDTFARFIVTFIFDGYELESIGAPHKHLPSFVMGPDGEIAANLTEYHLQGRLGKEIQCKAQSFWEGNSEKGDSLTSENKFKPIIEAAEIFDFDFDKGETQRIPFHPTVPITYYHCSLFPGKCPPTFAYYFYFDTIVASEAQCSFLWMNGTVPELPVYIRPFAGSRIFELKFEPYSADRLLNSSSLWHNFIVPTVTIRAFHSTEKLCSTMTDPHITSFDRQYYDFYENGDFYLVFGEVMVGELNHKLEVQVRQETCNGKYACNCGVIIRELNSAVKVGYDICGQWDSTITRSIFVTRLLEQYPYDGTEMKVDDVGRIFSIRMPSGTRLEIDGTNPWFSIQVYLAPIYHGKTSAYSLCGNSNGDKTDDFFDFNNARIPPDQSYFDQNPECGEDYFPPAMACTCGDDNLHVDCTNVEQNITIKSRANNELPYVWSSGVICVDPESPMPIPHNSGESNADYILDPADLFPPFVPDPNAGHNLTIKWPTPKNKTKEQVEQHCLSMLNVSSVYADCKAVANTDMIMQQCVSDIQLADEYLVTTAYAGTFGQECVNVLIAQENNSTAGGTPPAIDVTSIYTQICPGQCSGHGTCTNATCICHTGFIGADCSINETHPPILTGIVRSGICDIQQRPCATVSVFGSGLISSKTMKCRFSATGGGSAVDANGTFVTGSEVSCSIPNITTERPAITRQDISVANDGILYSNVLEFLTFDSVCMACGKDKVCTQKTDACLISDRCYANGSMKDVHTCQQCIPSQSISSWIEKPVAERLQPCSRTCDYGAQYKETVCTANNAVVKAEPVLCQDSSCEAIPEENLQGVVMTISNEDTTKMLLAPTNILSQVADVVNNYCSAHATQCCNSVGVPNGISLSSFTSLELCTYGSGYPQVGDTSSRIKIIVEMIPSQVQNECVKGAPQRSTDGEAAYADPDIIVAAVTEGKDAIEKALDITIVSVEKDDGSHSGAGLPVAKHTLILVTTVTAYAMTRLV